MPEKIYKIFSPSDVKHGLSLFKPEEIGSGRIWVICYKIIKP
jgi:hypothetical protein